MVWDSNWAEMPFAEGLRFGKMIKSVTTSSSPGGAAPEKYASEIYFHMEDGSTYKMWHEQDCCETVTVEDICGDIDDLNDAMVVRATEETGTPPKDKRDVWDDCSQTWTFYRIQTDKGEVVIRWLGESNGYYSESVSFAKRRQDDDV